MSPFLLLIVSLLVSQSHSLAAVENCRYHLQKAANKFCPNTTCVEAAAFELAVDLSDPMLALFFHLPDFCCRRICTYADLRRLCCDTRQKTKEP